VRCWIRLLVFMSCTGISTVRSTSFSTCSTRSTTLARILADCNKLVMPLSSSNASLGYRSLNVLSCPFHKAAAAANLSWRALSSSVSLTYSGVRSTCILLETRLSLFSSSASRAADFLSLSSMLAILRSSSTIWFSFSLRREV
jgi:hypothetical protein